MYSLLITRKSLSHVMLAVLGLVTMAGCATPYRSLHLHEAQITTAPNKSLEDSLHIWWRTNVFREPRNKEYMKMESRAGVTVAVLGVRNRSLDQLMLPHDLVFQHENGDAISPLSLEEALEALMVPLSFKEPGIEVESGLWRLGRTANHAIRIKSRVDFVNEMYEWYLVDRLVHSGHLQTGLIVLPVPTSAQWIVKLREQ